MRVLPVMIYLAVGVAMYLAFVSPAVDFSDPWLYIMVVAWPVMTLAVIFKWFGVIVAVIVAIVLCWSLVEYLRS